MRSSSKIFDKLIILFILFQPFIDAITMYQIRSPLKIPSISVLTRGLFFVVIIFWLYKNSSKKFLIYFLLGYFIIDIIYINFFTYNSLYQETAFLFQVFYFSFNIYFFINYDNKVINDKFIYKVYLIYLNLIIIPYLLGIGVYASDYYIGKSGYYGLFNGGNEISAIILGLMPITIYYLIKNKNWFLKLFTLIETLACVILIGTKTILLGTIIIIIYFIFNFIKRNYKIISRKQYIYLGLVFILILVISYFVLPMTPLFKNIYLALKFFNVNSIRDFTNIDVIDSIIFSGRLNLLKSINEIYMNSNILIKIFGLGESTLLNLKLIEIDIFDIFYSIGILGSLVYLIIFILIIKNIKLNSIYKFSFILLLIVSLFTGHILTSTCVSIYFGILVLLSKNDDNYIKK